MASKFKINNSYESPELLDYDIIGLHKKRTVIKGELVKIQYYKSFDDGVYSDLYVEESRTFNRDNIGLIVTRDLNIKWYLQDDSVGTQVNSIKYYFGTQVIDEGITRRGNIIAEAKLYVLGQVGQAYGFDLMNSVKVQIDLYTQGYKQPLIDAIEASTKPYLTQGMKDAIVDILTF